MTAQVTRWYAHPDGRVISRTTPAGAGVEAAPPAGCVPISGQEAQRRTAEIQAANDQAAAERELAAARQAEVEYQQLVHIGLPAHVARRLTGHEPGRVQDLTAKLTGRGHGDE